jgi:hypothetical protein
MPGRSRPDCRGSNLVADTETSTHYRPAAIMKARTYSYQSRPMTSKTTIGYREKGSEMQKSIRQQSRFSISDAQFRESPACHPRAYALSLRVSQKNPNWEGVRAAQLDQGQSRFRCVAGNDATALHDPDDRPGVRDRLARIGGKQHEIRAPACLNDPHVASMEGLSRSCAGSDWASGQLPRAVRTPDAALRRVRSTRSSGRCRSPAARPRRSSA